MSPRTKDIIAKTILWVFCTGLVAFVVATCIIIPGAFVSLLMLLALFGGVALVLWAALHLTERKQNRQ